MLTTTSFHQAANRPFEAVISRGLILPDEFINIHNVEGIALPQIPIPSSGRARMLPDSGAKGRTPANESTSKATIAVNDPIIREQTITKQQMNTVTESIAAFQGEQFAIDVARTRGESRFIEAAVGAIGGLAANKIRYNPATGDEAEDAGRSILKVKAALQKQGVDMSDLVFLVDPDFFGLIQESKIFGSRDYNLRADIASSTANVYRVGPYNFVVAGSYIWDTDLSDLTDDKPGNDFSEDKYQYNFATAGLKVVAYQRRVLHEGLWERPNLAFTPDDNQRTYTLIAACQNGTTVSQNKACGLVYQGASAPVLP